MCTTEDLAQQEIDIPSIRRETETVLASSSDRDGLRDGKGSRTHETSDGRGTLSPLLCSGRARGRQQRNPSASESHTQGGGGCKTMHPTPQRALVPGA